MDQNPSPILNQNESGQQQQAVNQDQSQNSNKALHTAIAIILLIFVFPIGLIFMWMATSWSKGFKWFLTLFFPIAIALPIVLIIVRSAVNKNAISAPVVVTSYTTYNSRANKIQFSYPKGWVVEERLPGITDIYICKTGTKSCKSNTNYNIGIANQGTKTTGVSLLAYAQSKNIAGSQYNISNDTNESKTSNGYEVVSSAKAHYYYISDGVNIFTVQGDKVIPTSKIEIDPAIINRIVDSLKINIQASAANANSSDAPPSINNSTQASTTNTYNIQNSTDYQKQTGYAPAKASGTVQSLSSSSSEVVILETSSQQALTFKITTNTIITDGTKSTFLAADKNVQIEYEGFSPSNALRIWVK
ncbi:MAG: hypothetical protein Q7S37_01995 [bacterium]|nr:hypothetical protein [bacterium]